MQFLEGIRVIDATQVLAGPWATMHLGDLGAEVVKIERPDIGDLSRGLPPYVGDVSSQYVALNRNKRSVAIDLSTDDGQQIAHEFVREADVFVENFKSGTPSVLGIDYETLSAVNPELIYCSIKGFDRGSPYEDNPSFDMVVQALSGVMSVTGQPDGPPTYVGIPVGDLAPAMYAVQSILGALLHRELHDAGGEFIEVSMLNALVAWLGVRLTAGSTEGEPYPRLGNMHANTAPYKMFETADGYIVVAIVGENLWSKFCAAIDREDLVDDSRFETNDDRIEHRTELYGTLDDVFLERSTDKWFQVMQECGVPAGPIRNTQEVIEDRYTDSQALLQSLATSDAAESVSVVRHPSNFRSTADHSPAAPPSLGEDTVAYLTAMGYDEGAISELRDKGVIHAPE